MPAKSPGGLIAGVSPELVSRLSFLLRHPPSTVSRSKSEGDPSKLCDSQRPAGHNPLQNRLKLASLPFPLPPQLICIRVASLSRKGLLPSLNGPKNGTYAGVQSRSFPRAKDLEVKSVGSGTQPANYCICSRITVLDAPQEHPVLIVELSLPTCQRIRSYRHVDLVNCGRYTEALFYYCRGATLSNVGVCSRLIQIRRMARGMPL